SGRASEASRYTPHFVRGTRRPGGLPSRLRVGRTLAGEAGQCRLDPAGGEVGGVLADLVGSAEPDRLDLALLTHDLLEDVGVVDTAVEDQADGVVPTTPGGQPVGEQQPVD